MAVATKKVQEKVSYSLYPTLLDAFWWARKLDNPLKWQELIDKINRVPKEFPLAAMKGVQFEEVINNILKGMKVKPNSDGNIETKDFFFDYSIVNKVANKLQYAKKQQEFIQGVIDTPKGKVKMYGFIDYSYPNMLVDLKTTGNYKPGKFKNNYQHKAYPLLANLGGGKIDRFNYLVTDFNHMYVEPYEPNQSMYEELVHDTCLFIDFLEENRGIITDTKIFGG